MPETFPGCTQHSLADTDSLNESGGQLGEYSVDSGQKAAVTDLAAEIPRNVIVLKTLLLLLLLVLLMLLLVAAAGSRSHHPSAVTEKKIGDSEYLQDVSPDTL